MSVVGRASVILDRRPALWATGTALLAFAAACALIAPPLGWLYRAVAGPVNLDFTIAIWHLSWLKNGFVKRGLPGTILNLVGLTADPNLLWIIHYVALAVAAAGLGVIAAHATRHLASAQRLAVLALLALSPALFFHAGRDVGRLTPLLFLALFAGARLFANGRVLAGALVLFAAGLVHEVVVLVGGVLFGVIALDRLMHGRTFTPVEWIKNSVAALTLLGLLVAVSAAKPTGLQEAYRSALPYVQDANALNSALWWFTANINVNIGENLCYFREYPLRWVYLAIDVAFIAVHVPVLFASFGRSRLILAGLLAVSFAPLTFLALDMGRWAALVVAGLWAYFLVILAREERPRRDLSRPVGLVLAAFYLLGPMSVSGTLLVPQALLPRLVGVSGQWDIARVCAPSMPAPPSP